MVIAGTEDQGVTEMMQTGRRNSDSGAAGPESACPGVGGRQEVPPPPAGGGGSRNICNESMPPLGGIQKTARDLDPRLLELKAAGLPDRWFEVAEAIGFESFIRMWTILDRENLTAGDGTYAVRLWIPKSRLYFRYQRNLYVRDLYLSGLSNRDIQLRIKSELDEDLSLRQIDRLTCKYKKQASAGPQDAT